MNEYRVVVIISSDIEWEGVSSLFPEIAQASTPYGSRFSLKMKIGEDEEEVLFLQGGWGKIAAASSAQYALLKWSPRILVNLGTCGGFRGVAQQHEIILVERTIVYDIMEAMTDADEALEHYSTDIDLSWLGEDYPMPVRRTSIVSGDRDLRPEDIPHLRARFQAVAADWESGAIAWTAKRNNARCLILRGVSDLVSEEGGEAYDGNVSVFRDNARAILKKLIETLPAWLAKAL